MIKIEFYLQKPGEEKSSLEYITINFTKPVKILEGKLAGHHSYGELYQSDIKHKTPIYSSFNNPIEALLNILGGIKIKFQILVAKGYIISDIESKQEWFLEKKSPETILQEKIDGVKNNKQISLEDKEKILKMLKG